MSLRPYLVRTTVSTDADDVWMEGSNDGHWYRREDVDAELAAARASRDALAVALRPFANYACNLSPDESCKCHNCIARAALASAGVDTSEKGGA